MRSSIAVAHLCAILLFLGLSRPGQCGMYGPEVEELTESNFDSLVTDSSETWLVKFYAPWCGHCQSSAPAFSKAARKLLGVARLGVINCDNEKSLASRFGIQGFPSLKVFKGTGRRARRPSDYEGARTSKAFAEHVRYVMPSFVARVKPSGIDAFFKDLPKLPHVLLFTDKSATSPLYKGLSARFKGGVACGEVRASDGKDLLEKYSVNKFPTVITFEAGKSAPEDGKVYGGAMDPKSLIEYLANVSKGAKIEGAEPGQQNLQEKTQEEMRFAQPKPYSGDVEEIVDGRSYEELCAKRPDGRMCALAFLAGGAKHSALEDIRKTAQKYLYDNLAFAVIDRENVGGKEFAKAFGVEADAFVVKRTKKPKFARMEGEQVEGEALAKFLDRMLGGDVSYKKLSGDMPEWKADVKEDRKAEDNNTNTDSSGTCGAKPDSQGSCGAKDEL